MVVHNAELLTPRGLSTMKIGECRYAMMTDDQGLVLNDPIFLKLEEDRFWFSIADSDMLFWVKGLALGRGLDVRVTEAAVSPLAVQGPKSTDLIRDLFGDWILDIKFYNFVATELDGIPMLLARSGWSPERGYELYLQDESRGDELWEKVMAAGQKYSIQPGVPAAEVASDNYIGQVSSVCFSPALGAHIAIATLAVEMCNVGTEVYVETPAGLRSAIVRNLPFTPRAG